MLAAQEQLVRRSAPVLEPGDHLVVSVHSRGPVRCSCGWTVPDGLRFDAAQDAHDRHMATLDPPHGQKAAALAWRLQTVVEAVAALLDETAGIDAETEPDEVAVLLYALRQGVTEKVKQIDSGLQSSLTDRWAPSKRPHIIDGIPAVSVRRTVKSTKWDHEATAWAVVDAHMGRDHLDGDLPPPWEVQRWFLDAAGIQYWRTTDLRSLDIDPDDYRHTIRGNLTVDFG